MIPIGNVEKSGYSPYKVLAVVAVISVIAMGAVFASSLAKVKTSAGATSPTASQASEYRAAMSIDPIKFVTKIQQSLPETNDTNMIMEKVGFAYNNYYAQLNELTVAHQDTETMYRGLQSVANALQTGYNDVQNAKTTAPSKIQGDYYALAQTVRNFLLLGRTEEQSP